VHGMLLSPTLYHAILAAGPSNVPGRLPQYTTPCTVQDVFAGNPTIQGTVQFV
jgi:hypothetical protein